MITSQMKETIENNAMGFATIDENGNPYCISIAYVKVVSDNQIIITNNYMGTTIENIKRNNNICLVVWNKEWEENCIGFQLQGKAEYFTEGKWKEFIEKMEENKDEPCKGAILVTISKTKKLGE